MFKHPVFFRKLNTYGQYAIIIISTLVIMKTLGDLNAI